MRDTHELLMWILASSCKGNHTRQMWTNVKYLTAVFNREIGYLRQGDFSVWKYLSTLQFLQLTTSQRVPTPVATFKRHPIKITVVILWQNTSGILPCCLSDTVFSVSMSKTFWALLHPCWEFAPKLVPNFNMKLLSVYFKCCEVFALFLQSIDLVEFTAFSEKMYQEICKKYSNMNWRIRLFYNH